MNVRLYTFVGFAFRVPVSADRRARHLLVQRKSRASRCGRAFPRIGIRRCFDDQEILDAALLSLQSRDDERDRSR